MKPQCASRWISPAEIPFRCDKEAHRTGRHHYSQESWEVYWYDRPGSEQDLADYGG